MAKKKNGQKQTSEKKYEAQHRRNLTAYQRQIDDIYRDVVSEAASISSLVGNFDIEKPFVFADYPITKHRLGKMLESLRNALSVAIVNGIRSEWTLANNKNNELCRQVFGDNIGLLTESQYNRYFSTNPKALEAFIERKANGLSLSDRVWNYANQFKKEIEAGIDLGLRDGLPATEMARDLKQYLKHPDKLFRRVRDEHGQLQLSKNAKAFHPGQGVYRSSYKNARRLAATECNIAYRTADHERCKNLDFVVGIHVILSNNHTLNGEPFTDICDELSGADENDTRGRYPKDFKFSGWHPLCRCHVLSILKTDEELDEDRRRMLNGEAPTEGSVNEVKDVPEEFKQWLEDNDERIQRAKSLPYFMKDNPDYCPSAKEVLKRHGVEGGAKAVMGSVVVDTAAGKEAKPDYSDIARKLGLATAPREKKAFVSFEPFSPAIVDHLDKIKVRAERNRLFESILNDERAEVFYENDKAKTAIFPGNKGKGKVWEQTKQMAVSLNKKGRSVCFLPELKGGSVSADAIIQFKGKWVIADFKHSNSFKSNTIMMDIHHGFVQANTLVVQMARGDAGTFKDAVEEIIRKKEWIGNIVLLNEYGKVCELDYKTLRSGKYKKLIQGFL